MFSSRREAARVYGARPRRGLRGFAAEPLEPRFLLAVNAPYGIPEWGDFMADIYQQRDAQVVGMADQGNPVAGAVQAVAPHPTDRNRMVIATVNGGIYWTDQAYQAPVFGTEPWWYATVTGRYASNAFGDLVYDRSDPNNNTLWASFARISSGAFDNPSPQGLIRSADGGRTWAPMANAAAAAAGAAGLTGGLAGVSIVNVVPTALTAPGGGQVVLAAGRSMQLNDSLGGIFRSTDGGNTFRRMSGGAGTNLPAGNFSSLVADPGNPNRFYAAMMSEDLDGDGRFDNGTEDANGNRQLDPGEDADGDGRLDRINEDSTNGFGDNSGAFDVGGIYRSDDGGATWNLANGASTNVIPAGVLATAARIKLAIQFYPGSGFSSLYAATVTALNRQVSGVFRAADTGQNWFAMDVPAVVEGDTAVGINPRVRPGSQGNLHLSLLPHPTDPRVVFIGGDRQPPGAGPDGRFGNNDDRFPNSVGATDATGRLFRGDFGQPVGQNPQQQWTPVTDNGANGTGPHADSRDMEWDASGNIVEADDGGVYRLVNPNDPPNRRWRAVTGGLSAREMYSVGYVHYTAQRQSSLGYLGGAQDVGSMVQMRLPPLTGNGSITGYKTMLGGDGGIVAVDEVSEPGRANIYLTSQNIGKLRRLIFDLGDDSLVAQEDRAMQIVGAPAGTGLGSAFDSTVQFITPYVLNSVDPSRLLIGSNHLYESTDRGNNLNLLTGTLVSNRPSPAAGIGQVQGMVYGGRIGNTTNVSLIIAAGGANLFVRQNGTGAPTQVTYPAGPVGNRTQGARDISVDPDNWQSMFVADANNRVYRSSDGGATLPNWTDITGDLGTIATDVRTILYVEIGGQSALFAGGRGGVYRTLNPYDANPHWRKFGNYLPNAAVNDIQYDPVDDILFVGTWGRGIFAMEYGASQVMFQPAILTVRGDQEVDKNDVFTLRLNPNASNLLDVMTGTFPYVIDIGLADQIVFRGGSGADIYNIEAVAATMPVLIDRGTANAIVHIGAGGGKITNINDTITLTGDANVGSMRLIVGGHADSTISVFTDLVVTSTATTGRVEGINPNVAPGGANLPITWDATARVNDLIVYSSARARTIQVPSVGVPTLIVGNAPAGSRDVVNVGSGNNLNAITANLTYRADRSNTNDVFLLNGSDNVARAITVDQFVPGGDTLPYGRIRGLAAGAIAFRMSSVNEVRASTAFNPTAISVFGAGSPGGLRSVVVNNQPTVTVQDMDLNGGVRSTNAPNVALRRNTLGDVTTITGASGGIVDANPSIAALVLTNTNTVTVTNNLVTGDVTVGTATAPNDPATGVQFTGNTIRGTLTVNRRSRVRLRNNTINRTVAAAGTLAVRQPGAQGADAPDIDAQGNRFGWIDLLGTATGAITGNEIGWRDVGVTALYQVALNLMATFAGTIDNNDVHNAVVGVNYAVPSPIVGNRIFGNTTGVVVPVNSTTGGLGFHPGSGRNEIYDNTAAGVNLTGRMQNQFVHDNPTGVIGSGILGGDVFELANLIANNAVGADFDGTIQFNRFARNAVGVLAHERQVVIHNLIYRGTTAGVKTNGADDVRVVHNTFYNVAGNSVQVDGGSVRAEIVNNVFQADGGYAINVAEDSRGGYFSDYNDIYTTGPGLMLRWRGVDFDDVIDLQQDIYRFDLHSIGTSAASPGFAAPRFLDVATDDYRVPALTGNLHLSSPTIDAGVPFIDVPAPPGFRNLLANGSFETGTTGGWAVNVGGGVGTAEPFVYAGTRYFAPGGVAAGFAEQTVDLVAAGFTAGQLDGNSLSAVFGGRVRSAAESPLVDEGRLIVAFLDGAGATIGGATTVTAGRATDRWELLGGRLAVPAGARQFRYRFEATRLAGSTNDAFLDAAFAWLRPNTAAPDLGAFGGNAGTDVDVATPHLQVLSPTLYADWEAADPHVIEWQTFGNTAGSPVRIQVFKDGAGAPFPITIVDSTPDTGRFPWIPQNSGLTPGTRGLRVQVSLVSDPSVSDRSAEPFALPEAGHVFYVNDSSTAGDEYATAVGDNRNSGRRPDSPKPSLEALLRTYRLGAADVVYVDTGVYDHVDTIVLGGNQQVGGDQGVTITGPLNVAHVARINGPAGSPVFDVNAANLVNLSHLTLAGGTYGVWVRNGGTRFTGSYLTSLNPALDGVRVEAGVTDVALDHLAVSGAGRDGISVDAANVPLAASTAHHNARYGIFYGNAGNAVLTGNESYNNRQGLNISNRIPGTTARVGDVNLALGLGNKFHDNAEYGIWTSSPGAAIAVAGNAVTNNGGSGAGSSGVGILVADGSTVTGNVVSGHFRGIVTNTAPVSNNRVFDSADAGILVLGITSVTGNVVYRNRVGVHVNAPFSGPTLANNLVYANTYRGVWLAGGANARVESNTVYQPTGDAVRVDAGGAQVRNNILFSGGPAANPPAGSPLTGFALSVDASSEVGFRSDYNLLFTSGTGRVGLWEGVPAAALGDWRGASSQDANSLSKPPALVDPDGADNVLGSNDDDFHEQSTAGSFHGGSLAPVINPATGLPAPAVSNLVNDAVLSPAVDRGDPASPYTNETAPSGGAINLGAYGNTAQASCSPTSYVTVLQPDGGESVLAGHNFTVRWTSQDSAGTVLIELLNGAAPVLTVAAAAPNNGAYVWSVPSNVAAGSNYFIRVTRSAAPLASDVSDAPFTISGSTQVFYVNDGTFAAGDWTTAAGNDANSGLDPAHPKASIKAILSAYNLGSGDVIRVDAGSYALTTNIGITPGDSGVRIEGYHGAAFPPRRATLTRAAAAGAVVFDFQGADDVTLDSLTLAGGGAAIGIFADAGADSDRITLSNLDVSGFGDYGVQVHGTNDNWTIANGRFHDAPAGGFYRTAISFDAIGGASNNTTVRDNAVFNNSRFGIAIGGGSNLVLSGNEIYGNGTAVSTDGSFGPLSVTGNKIHDNADGVLSNGNTTVSGNTISNHATGYGIQLNTGTASGNVIFGNRVGIAAFGLSGGAINNNRVYNNTTVGIAGGGLNVTGNVVYGNATGIEGFASPTWSNNVVYNNSAVGMALRGASAPLVINNTVYQPAGDALVIESTHNNLQFQNIRVRNNVLWALTGYAIAAGTDVAPGFASDFNDLYATGTGRVGLWEGVARPTLLAWQQATFNDSNSLSVDPRFVSVATADFHEQSTRGSFHGGSLAPVLNPANGLPVPAVATETNDAADSPAIDAGAPTDSAANEPAPNGGFVNLGAYGNTAQASKSAATWLRVTRPDGGESWSTRQTFAILWRGDNPGSGLVDIDLMHSAAGGALTLERNIATGVANNGRFDWAIPQGLPAASDYVVRVTRRGTPNVVDTSDNTVSISEGSGIYYVNDGLVLPGDWTTAVGDDANSGLDPAHPKASVSAILAAYALGPTDVIRVDRGIYLLSGNINVTTGDSGVTIRGFTGDTNTNLWRASVVGDGPTRYYRFGEASGTTATDSSGNNANATYVNGVALGQPGALDRDSDTAAGFNGTDQYVDLGSGFTSFAGGWSFETWIYPTTNGNYARVFDLGNGANANNVVLYRQGTSNNLAFNVWRNGAFGVEVLARNALTPNTWQHVAVTQTPAGLVTIYRDGLVVATGTTNFPADATRTKNYLGRSNFPTDAYFGGRMDEAAFYDKVLTAAQVHNRAQLAMRQALLNRGSVATNAYVFDLQGADDVTIDRLAMTGAYMAVNGGFGADADRISLTNNEIYGSAFFGVYVGGQNEDWNIAGNRIHDNYGNVNGEGGRVNVTGNLIYNAVFGAGVRVGSGNGSTVSGNEVYGNPREGISADATTITNNLVHDNGGTGILAGPNVVATGNTVYGHRLAAGIFNQGADVRGNVVYDNRDGIGMSAGLTAGNRVFNNTNTGIAMTLGVVQGNTVYSNGTGITGTNAAVVLGNLVYANRNLGVWINPANSAMVEGNTVYQLAGDALRLTLDTNNTRLALNRLRNNILWAAGAGAYAFNVTNDVETAVTSDYNDLYASGGAVMAHWGTVDFTSLREWAWELGLDVHSISADPQFVDADGADNVLGYRTAAPAADFGADDDFRVRPTSPTIDAADPLAPFVSEPLPDGQRANLGNYGATPQATPSPAAQSIQVTSPNGGEKVQAGRPVTVEWLSDGLAQTRVVGLINLGGDIVSSPGGDWGDGDVLATTRASYTGTFATDRSGVTDPAPVGVYQTLAYADSGVGRSLGYRIPVADGTYTIRLHFVEGFYSTGQRVFDVLLQGAVARANFDVYATAGTYYRAVALALPVTASGGNGIRLDLVNKTVNPAFICGIEITAVNAGGVANPTADVQLSTDGGANWATVGGAVAMDSRGRGRFTFTPSVSSDNALVRVVAREGSRPQDASDGPFQVAPQGRHFYVNDGATAGDVFTTAVGANANHGKSPDKPMATLAAVLACYDLDGGDVIHVDAGTYELFHNLWILPQDSGIRIEGAGAASGAAAGTGPVSLLDRNNVNGLLFDIRSADDVTFDHLSLTGAATAVYTYFSVHSDRITVTNCDIFGNPDTGIFVGTDNDRWTVVGNRVHDSQGAGRTGSGISFTGNFIDVVVRNNVVFNNPRFGIVLSGNYSNALPVTGNLVYGNGTGIASNCATVSGNEVHHNTVGIVVQPVSSLLTPSMALDNLVYSNGDGIVVAAGDSFPAVVVAGNRVFNHTGTGIAGGGNGVVRNNTVYSNRVGIVSPISAQWGGGTVHGNVVYFNADRGITVSGNGVKVMNNTVYQLVGDAVRVQGASNVQVYGNVLWVEGGADIYVAADGQNGFRSDSNLLSRGPGASAATGFWGGAVRATLADWQGASAQDGRSVAGNPSFVDVDGADNVLGYNPAGNGYDGGADDDFYLAAGSPGIDRGYTWTVAGTDLEGFARVDDPGTPNNGSPDLSAVPRATSAFAQSGTLLLRANNSYAVYDLPFAFPLLGASYARVYVSTEGSIHFEGPDLPFAGANTDAEFLRNRRVAPMWDNINVIAATDGVFVDTTVAGQVKLTWRGVNEANGQPVNFSAVLMSDGRMRFDYGAGNTGLTPTVGVSMGDGLRAMRVAGYDGAGELGGAASVDIGFVAGFVDIGAYEFRGSSNDVAPPTVTATVPGAVGGGGTIVVALNQPRVIGLTFSEAINSIDARAAGNYSIVGAGRDGVFGTADDVVVGFVPRYLAGAREVSLDLAAGFPEAGVYRLTVFGSAATGVHDLSGLRLDGNGDGAAGGDFVRTFTVVADSAAPAVAGVWVGSSRWSGAFRGALEAAGMGPAQFGYAVVGGAGQLAPLPWVAIDRVVVRFSEAVVVSADDLVVGGVSVADYYGISRFTYDPATFTATWTLTRPVSADKLLFRVDGGTGGVRDLAGNPLDGDWPNSAAPGIAGQFPSGNGTPGGDFILRLNVVPGDVTRDGRVDAVDLLRLRTRAGTSVGNPGGGAGAYGVLYDINGDGRNNVVDAALLRASIGRNLPVPEPTAPPRAVAAGREATSRRPADYLLSPADELGA